MQGNDIKTVLVTGANGFIGSRVCRLMFDSGYAIRIICRETSDLGLLTGIPYSKTIGDITRPESLAGAVKDVDYVIHLAGLTAARNEATFREVNERGTYNLITAVRRHNPRLKKFVYVSSAAATGPSHGLARHEDDPPAPITTYGRSKLAGEKVLVPFFNEIPITIIRPPAVYGPGDEAILTLFRLINRGFRPYLAGGRNRVQMVYVDDLAQAIKVAMEAARGKGEAYYIADEEAHTLRELIDCIGELTGRKGLRLSVPRWVMYLAAVMGELLGRIVGQPPIFSREKVREMTADWKLDVSKAQAQLGFVTAVDFAAGAKLTLEWYRRQGWLS